jgi:hypothetical protein
MKLVVTTKRALRLRPIGICALCILAVATSGGCTTAGPASVKRDRTEYTDVLGTTWKEQTLLNIIKMRYGDLPVFLEVSSVIASSSLQSTVTLGATWHVPPSQNAQSVGASGTYIDRPTISYAPLSGDKFARNLLRPISPAAVLSLVQAGYPVDVVLQLATRAINGVYNRSALPTRARAADPEFYQLLETWGRVQRSEAIDLRVEHRENDEGATIVFARDVPEDTARDLQTIMKILHLKEGLGEFTLSYGTVPRSSSDIAMLTRSMLEIFHEMGASIEAPSEDVQVGSTYQPLPTAAAPNRYDEPIVRIHSAATRPADAYAAIRYHDHWFWIADQDWVSKDRFSFLLVLFSLAETGVVAQSPLITVPAN